jgi:hypothetical protein
MTEIINFYDKLPKHLKSETKFIPNNYLFSNIEDRLNLLQGLLDTDGYCSKNGTIQYYSVSKDLTNGRLANSSILLIFPAKLSRA